MTIIMNPFEKLIERCIDKPWDWAALSNNPSITSEFVEQHLDRPWDWICLSKNSSMKP